MFSPKILLLPTEEKELNIEYLTVNQFQYYIKPNKGEKNLLGMYIYIYIYIYIGTSENSR